MAEFSLTPPTYLGEFDDVVDRFPWASERALDAVDSILLRHLLGTSIGLLNDGYLASQPILLEMAGNTNSLLCRMLETGFLRVLSAAGRPSRSIEQRAASGVVSHAARIAAPDWVEIAEKLDRLSPAPWPKADLTPGFRQLALRAAAHLESAPVSDQMASLSFPSLQLRRFIELLEEHPFAPRTQLEALLALAVRAREIDLEARNDAMVLGNIIYHLNFAATLALERVDGAFASTLLNHNTSGLLGMERMPTSLHISIFPSAIAKELVHGLVDALANPEHNLSRIRRAFLRSPLDENTQAAYRAALVPFSRDDGIPVAPAFVLQPHFADSSTILACFNFKDFRKSNNSSICSIFVSREQAHDILRT
ncbi:hypothetical protein [Novosphingobium kaempferiae]|uniref:hypothetical protein n=1 Tax=Novosphingobium kaempferiae TaxID=2896849 RepID=UPI001E5EBECA|nr:hypothetical protein [Novosphingobium kaempferiae]